MTLIGAAGAIGAKALYLLFIWLASAAASAWMAERKGYGERLGLTFGLVLTFVGFILVLLLPGRPGSAWKVEGPLPRRRSADRPAVAGPAVGPGGPGGAGGAGAGDPPSEGDPAPRSAGDAPPPPAGDPPPPAAGDAPPPAAGDAPPPAAGDAPPRSAGDPQPPAA